MGVRVREKIPDSGVFWVFINHHGKRTSRMIGKESTALEVAEQIKAKLTLNQFSFETENPKKPIPTFKQYADSWIKVTVPATCKASTQEDYEAILDNHVLPVFGDLALTDITRGKIKDFILEKLNSGLAASTVTHYRNVISGVLNKAVDDEMIPANAGSP